jgi:hypothetical protein
MEPIVEEHDERCDHKVIARDERRDARREGKSK